MSEKEKFLFPLMIIKQETTMKNTIHFFILLISFFYTQQDVKADHQTQAYENYLNTIKTLQGNFTQKNPDGKIMTGKIYMSRPGKMRLDYNPPSPLLIIADGEWLTQYDRDIDDMSFMSLDSSPASLLLNKSLDFNGIFSVTAITTREYNKTYISLARKEDIDSGLITLVFNNDPIALDAWIVEDVSGKKTVVTLSKIKVNLPISSKYFTEKNLTHLQKAAD